MHLLQDPAEGQTLDFAKESCDPKHGGIVDDTFGVTGARRVPFDEAAEFQRSKFGDRDGKSKGGMQDNLTKLLDWKIKKCESKCESS